MKTYKLFNLKNPFGKQEEALNKSLGAHMVKHSVFLRNFSFLSNTLIICFLFETNFALQVPRTRPKASEKRYESKGHLCDNTETICQ
jgi:hypothetical protein